jgi:protein SCO1/2
MSAGRWMRTLVRAAPSALLFAALTTSAIAQPAPPSGIAFDQHLGARVPLDVPFVDANGRATTLAALLDGRPAILVPGYYECPNLCSAVRESLRASLARVDLAADARYRVIAISIDPGETASDAVHARAALGASGAADAGIVAVASSAGAAPAHGDANDGPLGFAAMPTLRGWHFLTGTGTATRALADTIGFHYVYDAQLHQYAHPSGVVVITREGRVSRYFFGVDYPPRALRESLVAAAGDDVGSPVRTLLLRCLHYDPAIGRHSGAVVAAARVLGLACIALLGWMVMHLCRRERSRGTGAGP